MTIKSVGDSFLFACCSLSLFVGMGCQPSSQQAPRPAVSQEQRDLVINSKKLTEQEELQILETSRKQQKLETQKNQELAPQVPGPGDQNLDEPDEESESSAIPNGESAGEPSLLPTELELSASKRQSNKPLFRNFYQDSSVDSKRECKYISTIAAAPPAKMVVLTFDDGPSPEHTPQILEILAMHHIKATFFIQGDHAQENPNLIYRVKREGHLIGNHSYSHPNFHKLTRGQKEAQIVTTEPLLLGTMEDRFLFRYPFGNSSCETSAFLKRYKYQIVGWHVDSCDWGYEQTGRVSAVNASICEVRSENVSRFAKHVVESVQKRNGGIVLLHDTLKITADSLEVIILKLRQDGYTFTNLNDSSFRQSLL